jgi:hypothetical protein
MEEKMEAKNLLRSLTRYDRLLSQFRKINKINVREDRHKIIKF